MTIQIATLQHWISAIVDCLSAANTKQNDLQDEDTCLWVIEITKK